MVHESLIIAFDKTLGHAPEKDDVKGVISPFSTEIPENGIFEGLYTETIARRHHAYYLSTGRLKKYSTFEEWTSDLVSTQINGVTIYGRMVFPYGRYDEWHYPEAEAEGFKIKDGTIHHTVQVKDIPLKELTRLDSYAFVSKEGIWFEKNLTKGGLFNDHLSMLDHEDYLAYVIIHM